MTKDEEVAAARKKLESAHFVFTTMVYEKSTLKEFAAASKTVQNAYAAFDKSVRGRYFGGAK